MWIPLLLALGPSVPPADDLLARVPSDAAFVVSLRDATRLRSLRGKSAWYDWFEHVLVNLPAAVEFEAPDVAQIFEELEEAVLFDESVEEGSTYGMWLRARAGGDLEALLVEHMGGAAQAGTSTPQGMLLSRLQEDGRHEALLIGGDGLYAWFSSADADRLPDLLTTRGEPDRLTDVRRSVGSTAQVEVWLDIRTLARSAGGAVPDAVRPIVTEVLDDLGWTYSGVAFGEGEQLEAWGAQTLGTENWLGALVDRSALRIDPDMLAWVPAGCDTIQLSAVDSAALVNGVLDALERAAPEEGQQARMGLASFGDMLGVDLVDDLLRSTGGQILTWGSGLADAFDSGPAAEAPGQAYVVSLADGPRFGDALLSVLEGTGMAAAADVRAVGDHDLYAFDTEEGPVALLTTDEVALVWMAGASHEHALARLAGEPSKSELDDEAWAAWWRARGDAFQAGTMRAHLFVQAVAAGSDGMLGMRAPDLGALTVFQDGAPQDLTGFLCWTARRTPTDVRVHFEVR